MSVDVFTFAMQFEKDGEAYYRDLASKCNLEGLKNILILMAEDEAKHYEVLKQLKDREGTEIIDTAVLLNAKNIFTRIKDSGQDLPTDISEIEFYKKAIKVEKDSEDFYREKAAEVAADDPKAEEIMLKIAEEEKKHQFLLENMVNFLSRPQQWVEDAEFNHLIDY